MRIEVSLESLPLRYAKLGLDEVLKREYGLQLRARIPLVLGIEPDQFDNLGVESQVTRRSKYHSGLVLRRIISSLLGIPLCIFEHMHELVPIFSSVQSAF